MRPDRALPRLPVLLVVLALLVPLVAACGSGSTSAGLNVTVIDAGDRKEPVSLSGNDLDGKPVDLATYRGQAVVINVWGSWCGPCLKEGSILAAVSTSSDVPFLGIDIRDNASSAAAYNRKEGITYPSIEDFGGQTLLGFQDYPAISTPTTYVLDAEGRVAAVISGPVPSEQSFRDLIDDVVASG